MPQRLCTACASVLSPQTKEIFHQVSSGTSRIPLCTREFL